MAEPFKNLLNEKVVNELAAELQKAWKDFPRQRFVARATSGLSSLELKARAQHIAEALEACLPDPPARAMDIVTKALGPKLTVTEGYGSTVFRYLPYSTWLEKHGPRDVEAALLANKALTQRFSAEFSIRSLLTHAPKATLRTLHTWTRDENPHVRRLVSEGTRPFLPWAKRLPELPKTPNVTLELLEHLKDDPTEYVRRSVANHLNDLSKEHPLVVLKTAGRWLAESKTPERKKLVEHALRTLVKAGDAKALNLLGATGAALTLSGSVTPSKIDLGDPITIEATVLNRGSKKTHVVLEAVVHFRKPSGSSAKKFRLGRVDLGALEETTVVKRLVIQHRSIRRLHPGMHRVELQANGLTAVLGQFDLTL
jgi:3-methyladenine DNA glycosylase AlkC